MARIEGYTPHITPIDLSDSREKCAKFGGWNPATKVCTPIMFSALMEKAGGSCFYAEQWTLDCITLSVEAGAVEEDYWVEQLFFSQKDFDHFCDALLDLGDWWVNDRYFCAFQQLTNECEQGVLTYPDISDALRRANEDRKQSATKE